ncbi:MAG: DNA polymerase III subunit alpha [Candidatus Babeliales bacterium]|nr:DNA polymerase III subunit alpha [Candidatus Babeliales bacterium]
MEKHFTHLHVHSEFSLLDGAISLDKLIEFGKKNALKALCISDHGNIFGAVKFFQKCNKAGIKPILAIEAYLTEDANIKSVENKYYHLIIIVQNATGYKNLCKLISFSYQHGFYFKPRIDYKILEQHSEGLIVTTACLGGHIPQLLMKNNNAEAEKMIDWYLRVFGPDRFYFEVQPEDQKEQQILNQKLFEWGAKKGVQVVATSDCHYVNEEDREAHEIMLSIQTHAKIDDPNRFTFGECRAFMRTQSQMLEIFKDHEEVIWNSGKIADMCDFNFELGKLFFPKFEIPEEHTTESYFKHLSQIGFDKLLENERFPKEEKEHYQARLDLEINLIIKMGFIGYFLVVSDFIQWSRKNGVPVGPGRGSAAGSLVAWALEITNIDPIKYNLLFERFLNPERVSMPDIDIDFCIEGRERVIQYIRDRYGHDKVCQIITFGTMMAKGVIKDVARVLGFPFEDSNALTDLIPDTLKISITDSIEQEPKLKNLIDSNPKVAHMINIALKLEGLTRHASKHAAGIVISPEPIEEILPLFVPTKSTELVTQYAMTELEALGFLKIDLLGLKNLTLIDKALKLIEKNHNIKIDIDKIPLDNPKVYELLGLGKTSGVFQLESDGIKDVLRRLKAEKFEDIIAVNALYRPGPLGSGMVDDFIERKHGRQKIEYLFPELEDVLKETNGVIVYQEQVMKIASTIAGYSLGESDLLRRAMGKKKAEEMAKQRAIFMEKAQTRGFNPQKAKQLFDLMEYFAGYGFNKSHSAAYALIAYQTAYLKSNYPAEFMACLISLEASDADSMVKYLDEAKGMGIEILPPDINQSDICFTVPISSSGPNKKILFGLQGIKSVGLASLENILIERAKKPFTDIMDFCFRIDLRTSNKRVIENLISAGALDRLPGNRAQKYAEVQKIMDIAADKKKAALTGQMGLFEMTKKPGDTAVEMHAFQQKDDWTIQEKLEKEKEVIGFYLSSHPLDTYQELKWLNVSSFEDIMKKIETAVMQDILITGYGVKKSHKVIATKKGDNMAFMQIEDRNAVAEIIIFPKLFQKVEQWLNTYNIFIVKGSLDFTSTSKCKIKANAIVPLELLFQHWPEFEEISIDFADNFNQQNLDIIKNSFKRGKTRMSFEFLENQKKLKLKTRHTVGFDLEILKSIDTHAIKFKLTP